ncbi:MAG: histidinol phosphate phosphatase domain-containing protein [Caldimicrobium sp.]|nr:histidinol phosphate phosphatase domain-containing protein [Caldimicrobium sp.]MDW8182370.1 histidinol phosphate phosphatase domain-containing protein [Caldimicrobium sp.]
MFDFHCHSVFSDGELIPAEIWRRVKVLGYTAIAITDHADHSNYQLIINNLIKIREAFSGLSPRILVGVELTHVPPELIPELINRARLSGAEIVVVHGETIVEPVAEGTNRAAIIGGADILAHPGLISEEEVKLAGAKGVFLELSGRKGHSFTNGHVAKLALKHGVPLVINSDAHSPSDLLTQDLAFKIATGAGLSKDEVENLWKIVQTRFLKD